MLKRFISALLLSSVVCSAQAQMATYQEGTHYQRLNSAQATSGEQIEVIEFFSYACPHCYDFEPNLSKWKKSKPADVKLTLLPAVFNDAYIPLAKAHYALEIMGKLGKMHRVLFEAIHKQKKPVKTLEQIADIVEAQGIDRSEFLDSANSFPVDSSVRKTSQIYAQYRITGVPAVAVNGKYMVTGQMAGSYAKMTSIISYLVAKEKQGLKARKSSKKAAAAKQK